MVSHQEGTVRTRGKAMDAASVGNQDDRRRYQGRCRETRQVGAQHSRQEMIKRRRQEHAKWKRRRTVGSRRSWRHRHVEEETSFS